MSAGQGTIRAVKQCMRLLGVLVSLAALVVAYPGVASAHVLKEDNGISALLHIEPDDSAVAGQPTELKIDFGDSQDAFSLANCDCQLQLAVNEDQVIKTVTLLPGPNGGTLDTTATVTFPKVDHYDARINGHATDGSFPDFHLDFDINVAVAKDSSRALSGSDILLLSGAALVVVVPLLYGALKYSRRTSS